MLTLNRIRDNGIQTTGELYLNGEYICKTLELPYKNNLPLISCIPPGIYDIVERRSIKHGRHLHILNVPNRKYILIHAGNFIRQIKGCILVGESLKDIDNDGIKDVTNSRVTLKKLLELYEFFSKIEIKPAIYVED